MELNKIHQGDWIELSKQLDDESIDMIMTSPPYWGLRDYGVDGQLGLEEHPNLFIKKLVEGFAVLKQKLKKTGSLYLNLGDTYFGSPAGNKDQSKETGEGMFKGRDNLRENNVAKKKVWKALRSGEPDPKLPERLRAREQFKGNKSKWLQPKQLMLMPVRVAIAMQEDGWILRNDIIWSKPNPMPSSVKDRLNTTYEHIFHFVKARKYYYDLDSIREKHKDPNRGLGEKDTPNKINNQKIAGWTLKKGIREYNPLGKNPGDTWTITTQPFPASHFATYPEKLCIKPIKSSCPKEICSKCGFIRERIVEPTEEYKKLLGKAWLNHKEDMTKGNMKKTTTSTVAQYITKGFTTCKCNSKFKPGIVLDPFSGSATTLFVAKKLEKNFIGFEISEEYIKIAEMRLKGCKGWQYKESQNNKKLTAFQ